MEGKQGPPPSSKSGAWAARLTQRRGAPGPALCLLGGHGKSGSGIVTGVACGLPLHPAETSLSFHTRVTERPRPRRPYGSENILETNTPERQQEEAGGGDIGENVGSS